jgi:hypothetical protein
MPDTELDRQLREFLGNAARERADGHTTTALHKAVVTVTDALSLHVKDCSEKWVKNEEQHRSVHKRLTTLESAPSVRPPGAESEPEPEITNVHDLVRIADAIKRATIVGYESPKLTPDDTVKQVVAEEQRKLEEKKEYKRLRDEESKRDHDKEQHSRDLRRTVLGAVGGAATLGLAWLVNWMMTLHH